MKVSELIDKTIGRVPAHVRYPGMVVLLLVGSVSAQMALLHAATSDGGAQVEPGYYDRAVAWDDYAREYERSSALGWDVEVVRRGPRVIVSVFDANRAPVDLDSLSVLLSRPHIAGDPTEPERHAAGPSTRWFDLAEPAPGLWDVHVEAVDATGRRFVTTARQDW